MVVLACIENADVARTKFDHTGRFDREHFNSISSSIVSMRCQQIHSYRILIFIFVKACDI